MFSEQSCQAIKLLHVACENVSQASICDIIESHKGVVEIYSNDLPLPDLLYEEIVRWKNLCDKMEDPKPKNLQASLLKCNKQALPNIHTLLCIGCTLSVTSCECEGCASALGRLSNYVRASMKDERLGALTLIHVHRDKVEALEKTEITKLFIKLHPRGMELPSLVI
ncbi:52 kDa repressor of the inhibitor of the protein kinase-like [Hydra vulgaris]|uniref:52 kDa repressor of the inhibitor of the protein kinase-like n=1 Tax=Hydra vulgaris TaxID=6087 RepID=A0ABM4BV26_HYDVU